jgi:hypothetical protein
MEKQCKNIKARFIILSCVCFLGCHNYQLFSTAQCETALESVWVAKSNDYEYVNYNSISYLVFEGKFKDTFEIRLNGKLILRQFMKSEKSLEVIPEMVSLKTNSLKNALEVNLLNESKCFKVAQLKKFSYCYISRNENLWFIEYSNFKREYK